ncbi:MAG TPA: sodium/glutamate symporter, partial [Pyrinomonadaceae bacterium]|nr:sodium/glutamate symporter [Pyrinomonadaceae bacterium]
YGALRAVRPLARLSIPAAAVGGLLFASAALALRGSGALGIALDTSLRAPLQTVFFTTIGLGATLSLLRAGGWRTGFFWLIASLTAVVQNLAGIGLARALDAPAALGIICGSLTLTGGPSTGVAFEPLFASMGIEGAGALIIASATFGIFTASIVGNPVATFLIRRFRLAPTTDEGAATEGVRGAAVEREAERLWAFGPRFEADEADETDKMDAVARRTPEAATLTSQTVLYNLLLIFVAMGLGALIYLNVSSPRFTFPAYIGAMLVAALLRNLDDRFGWFRIDVRAVELIGTVSLALFLVIALMNLELWKMAGLALPMLVILTMQVLLMIVYAVVVTFFLMGRDYEAAVTASGHVGFGLGITANAVANMEALASRFAPAPRSFLVVPVVGAFFIDFSNSLIITLFANLVR